MSPLQKAFHRSGAAFAEEDFISRHAHARFAMHPLWFVFKALYALGVSAVRFCSEVTHGAQFSQRLNLSGTVERSAGSGRSVQDGKRERWSTYGRKLLHARRPGSTLAQQSYRATMGCHGRGAPDGWRRLLPLDRRPKARER
jgi:hypothetical protein